MRKIEKKCTPEYYQAILNGDKKFEIRLADWECKKNDILILREWDPKKNTYTGRWLEKKITFILNTKDLKYFSKKDIQKYGFQVISLANID